MIRAMVVDRVPLAHKIARLKEAHRAAVNLRYAIRSVIDDVAPVLASDGARAMICALLPFADDTVAALNRCIGEPGPQSGEVEDAFRLVGTLIGLVGTLPAGLSAAPADVTDERRALLDGMRDAAEMLSERIMWAGGLSRASRERVGLADVPPYESLQ